MSENEVESASVSPRLQGDSSEATLGDFWPKIAQNKWLFVAATLAGLTIGVGYTVWVPPRYEARTSFILPSIRPTPSGASALAASLGVGAPSGDTTLAMFRKILESDRVLRAVATPDKLDPEDLKVIRKVEDDSKSNTISISVTNRDPKLALRLTQRFLSELRKVNSELSLPSKGRKSELLVRTLANRERSLTQAEEQLELFTLNAKTAPAIPTASNASAGASAPAIAPAFRYRDQLTGVSLELETIARKLEVARNRSAVAASAHAPDYPPVSKWIGILQGQESRLAQLKTQFTEGSEEVADAQRAYDATLRLMRADVKKYARLIEQGVSGGVANLSDDEQALLQRVQSLRELADAAPREATEYQRLTRKVATLTTIVTQLRLQVEQARFEKEDDPNRWEVLDAPSIGEKPINKNYTRNILLAVLGLNFFAVPIALRRRR